MKNSDYKLNNKIVSLLVVGHIVFIFLGSFAQIYEMDSAHFFLSAGITFFFSSWIVILSDIVKQRIFNKTFWIVTMFIIPSIAMFFYIFMRNRLIRLGEKNNKAGDLG
ncbi:MAG: hypothetical protein U9N51_07575 [Bacteroidota bacterium]|nr:hypothetical protein [Bacteroidota bacterium]